ncbi:MAG: short-chain dehydrogenase [Firmicutes bacterium]|nr:short-chain dehydrogenase [Bacillota bacterium]
MRNVLLLGGTSIMKPLALRLLKEGSQVLVVGRTSAPVRAMEVEAGLEAERLKGIALDYHDGERLRRWINHMQLMYGPIDEVIAWVRGDWRSVLEGVDQEIAAYRRNPWHLYHILGGDLLREFPPPPEWSPLCRYHRVILDRHGDHGLTAADITQGIYEAMARQWEECIIRPDLRE